MKFQQIGMFLVEVCAAGHVVYNIMLLDKLKRTSRGLFYDKKTTDRTLTIIGNTLYYLMALVVLVFTVKEITKSWDYYTFSFVKGLAIGAAICSLAVSVLVWILGVLGYIIYVMCHVNKEEVPDTVKNYHHMENIIKETTGALVSCVVALEFLGII